MNGVWGGQIENEWVEYFYYFLVRSFACRSQIKKYQEVFWILLDVGCAFCFVNERFKNLTIDENSD